MAEIYNCIESFVQLLNIRYEFIIGRKGVTLSIPLCFDKKSFSHLLGLQHIRDRLELPKNSVLLFNKLLKREIKEEYITSSADFPKIKNRIHFLKHLEYIFDDNRTVFKYNEHRTQSFSSIQAEFLLKNTIEQTNVFLFLDQNENGNYFCRSFFPEEKLDYTKGQTSWTLLCKRKTFIKENRTETLYSRISGSIQ